MSVNGKYCRCERGIEQRRRRGGDEWFDVAAAVAAGALPSATAAGPANVPGCATGPSLPTATLPERGARLLLPTATVPVPATEPYPDWCSAVRTPTHFPATLFPSVHSSANPRPTRLLSTVPATANIQLKYLIFY